MNNRIECLSCSDEGVVWCVLQGSGTQVSSELETQVLITALALPFGGKILFAATEAGVVRCYKYPLTGELDLQHSSFESG